MIAIASEDVIFERAEETGPLRTGSLRPIGEIVGQLLAGYELLGPEVHAAAHDSGRIGQARGSLVAVRPLDSLDPTESMLAEAITH